MTARMFARVLFIVAAPVAGAQPTSPSGAQIPIRQLSAPDAVAKELIGAPSGLKQFADGRVIVNDVIKQRLIVYDPTLATFTVAADSSGAGPTLYPRSFLMTNIYNYLGDSALFPDMTAQAFILIEPGGKFGRAVAHPRPRDLGGISTPYAGSPAFDAQGRFIYRAGGNGMRPAPAPLAPGAPPSARRTQDTVALVRADFDSRVIDTIAHVSIPVITGTQIKRDPATNKALSASVVINPVPVAPDDWAVLSDGTLGIVRAHDYHVDWVYPDGRQVSTPKMPFDWRRLTDEDKLRKIDSVKHAIDSVAKVTGRGYGMIITGSSASNKPDTLFPTVEFAPLTEMLDYVPAIRQGAVKADRDNHLWILPTTTLSAVGGGPLYDVVNKQGEIVERVQLPPNYFIAGFGPNGVIYLLTGDRAKGYTLERRHVVRSGGRAQ